MPKKPPSKRRSAQAISPLAIFQSLSVQAQEDLIIDRVFELARGGHKPAIQWIAAHPRTRVQVQYAHVYRLTETEEIHSGESRQTLQIDAIVGMGTNAAPDEWEDNYISLLIHADTADRTLQWRNWLVSDYEWRGKNKNLLCLLFGDWIKKTRVLIEQSPGADIDVVPEDSEFTLASFVTAIESATCWVKA